MRTSAWALGFVLFWSSGFVGAVLAAPAGTMAGMLAWRYLVTAAVLVVIVLLTGRGQATRRELVQQGVLGLLSHVVFLGGVFGAAGAGVGPGTVALVCALQPMVVTVAGRVWWGDRVRARQIVGLLTGLLAVAATVGGGATASAGLLLAAGSLLGLSGAALLERRWQPQTDVLLGLCIQVVLSAGVFTGYAYALGSWSVPVTPRILAALAWLIVLSGLGGYLTFVVCLRRLGATTTSLLLYLTPPVTTLWAWAMLGISPSGSQLLGLAMGALAVALAWPPGEPVEQMARTQPTRLPVPRRSSRSRVGAARLRPPSR